MKKLKKKVKKLEVYETAQQVIEKFPEAKLDSRGCLDFNDKLKGCDFSNHYLIVDNGEYFMAPKKVIDEEYEPE
jgi:hypothetical protein